MNLVELGSLVFVHRTQALASYCTATAAYLSFCLFDKQYE